MLAVFHVALDGSDSNPGTAAEPLRTIHAAILAAAEGADGADEIRVMGGIYAQDAFDGPLVIPNAQNLANLQVEGGYRAGFATPDGSSPTIYRRQGPGAFVTIQDDDVTIIGIDFNNGGVETTDIGIAVSGSNAELRNVRVADASIGVDGNQANNLLLNNVVARDNNIGARVTNGSVTVEGGSYSGNATGLQLSRNNGVMLNSVRVEDNIVDGAILLFNAGDVIVTGGEYSRNGNDGLVIHLALDSILTADGIASHNNGGSGISVFGVSGDESSILNSSATENTLWGFSAEGDGSFTATNLTASDNQIGLLLQLTGEVVVHGGTFEDNLEYGLDIRAREFDGVGLDGPDLNSAGPQGYDVDGVGVGPDDNDFGGPFGPGGATSVLIDGGTYSHNGVGFRVRDASFLLVEGVTMKGNVLNLGGLVDNVPFFEYRSGNAGQDEFVLADAQLRHTRSSDGQQPISHIGVNVLTVRAGDGDDRIALNLAPAAILPSLVLDGNEGHDRVVIHDAPDNDANLTVGDFGSEEAISIVNIESLYLYGLDGNDRLVNATATDSLIDGGPGDDTLVGGSGSDVLLGSAGGDLLLGGGGNDLLAPYLDSLGNKFKEPGQIQLLEAGAGHNVLAVATDTFLNTLAFEEEPDFSILPGGGSRYETISDARVSRFLKDNGPEPSLVDVLQFAAMPVTIGLYDPLGGFFFQRGHNSAGPADKTFGFGPGGEGWLPIVGDFNGNGKATTGVYHQATGTFFLGNSNAPGAADVVFRFGPAELEWLPVVGDWDGDGVETVGLYNGESFFLTNRHAAGQADVTFNFGPAGADWIPLAGDWNKDGFDTVALYSGETFFMRNQLAGGNADLTFGFGPTQQGWLPVAGDWNADGFDNVGLYSGQAFFLRNSLSAGTADYQFTFGPADAGWLPLVGNWDDSANLLQVIGGTLPSPLQATATPGIEPPGGGKLTAAQLHSIVDVALGAWAAVGLQPNLLDLLGTAEIRTADLPNGYLGLAAGSVIYLDADAAGWGWHAEPELQGLADDRIDLVTVLAHEFGHLLGLDDVEVGAAVDSLMDELLAPGVRRLPSAADVDLIHAAGLWSDEHRPGK